MNTPSASNSKATRQIIDWYDANARVLPWRIAPINSQPHFLPDPYFVWLSEIMLQQTQVITVQAYFQKFISLWPTLNDLANSELEDVLKAWAGLGYYSRARNLKKCADIIYLEYQGKFPGDVELLKKLPGIGEYTSAAISAIAFGKQVAVVDGNVERVISRIHAISTPVSNAKNEIRELTGLLVPTERPGDFAQAVMDLGATICTPKKPSCDRCPWQADCKAHLQFDPGDFPVKTPKKAIPKRTGAAFVAITQRGEILLRKRSGKGMLAGMSEVPSTHWSSRQDGETDIGAAPFSGKWLTAGQVTHLFTHFHLAMKVYYCVLGDRAKVDGWWVKKENVMNEALPNLMKKAITLALEKIKDNQ